MTAPVLTPVVRDAAAPGWAGAPELPHGIVGSLVIAFFCLALLAGPAYDTSRTYDFSHQIDSKNYMKVAAGEKNVYVTQRYRVVVPWLARAVHLPIQMVYGAIWPQRDTTDHQLRFGFLLVNLGFMSLFALVLVRTCQAYGLGAAACCLAVVGILTTRTAHYLTALPLVDSFHLLCVAMVFLAIKTGNGHLLALGILLGPLSKESFVFIAPVTLLFGNLRVWVQLVLYASAGLLVLAVHSYIDLGSTPSDAGTLHNALVHVQNIPVSLKRLASPGGMGDVFSVLGLFNFVWLFALLLPNRRALLTKIDLPLWLLLASAGVQALISESLSRMLFVAAPLWAVLLGQGFQIGSDWWLGRNQPVPRADTPSDCVVARAA
jgi:hypothetical protein